MKKEEIKSMYKEAGNQTLETLPMFLKKITEDYQHDYDSICHAVTSAGLAAMNSVNKSKQGGITGFQAGAIMWEFITHWTYKGNKIGLKITNYDDLLYPQYGDKFNKVLSKRVWESLQKEAKERIKDNDACDIVMEHWKSIVNGIIPFGFTIEED